MLSKKLLSRIAAVGYALLPAVVLAQTSGEVDLRVLQIKSTINTVIGFLFVLATLIFLWGVIKFVANSADEKKRAEAKGIMTGGIIGLAVMAAVWGIANILVSYFGVEGSGIPTGPGNIP